MEDGASHTFKQGQSATRHMADMAARMAVDATVGATPEEATEAVGAAALPMAASYTFTTGHKCMGCKTLFVLACNARRHRDACCPGAEVCAVKCAMAEVDHNNNIISVPQTNSYAQVFNGNNNSNNTLNVFVVRDQYADIIKAGTEAEREAIIQTILENPVVRAATTCPYNAVAGIFHHTKGASGPHKLRNVHTKDRKVVELQPDGPHEYHQSEYCKAEALRLVRILRHGADAVREDPGAARHLKEWAADVLKMLTGGTPPTYGERLERYCRSDSGFYKLPKHSREDVMTAVKNIGPLIVKK